MSVARSLASRSAKSVGCGVARSAGGVLPVNQHRFPSAFGSWLDKTRLTVSGNVIAAPDGSTTASKLIASTDNNSHSLSDLSLNVETGTNVVHSVHLKAGEYTWAAMYDSNNAKGRYFNIANGTAGGNFVAAPAGYGITSLGGGWYRAWIHVLTTATNTRLRIYLGEADGDSSFVGNASDGLFAWGTQVEFDASTPGTFVGYLG